MTAIDNQVLDYPVSPLANRRGLKAGQSRVGLLMLLPAAIAFAAVILYPFLQALGLSLFEYTVEMMSPRWIGLGNFTKLLSDPAVWGSFATTAVYVTLTTAGTLVLGLGWALLMI